MARMDYTVFDRVMRRDATLAAVPLYEHGVDYPVIAEIMGYPKDDLDLSTQAGYLEFWRRWISFYEQMNYPYVSIDMGAAFPQIHSLAGKGETDKLTRGYVDENAGPIQTMEDVECDALWPDADSIFDYDTYAKLLSMVPEHMKAVGGCSGGPFEHATFLMGLTNFCIAVCEQPELVAALMERISTRLIGVAERLAQFEKLGVYRFGDDLGFTESTMISPSALREYVLPWQKRIVAAVHRAGKKFLLHSCGKIDAVMEDLIEDVGIDAKHSFEDKATPVAEAKRLWGDRIAIIGGIDVDFLCRATEQAIYDRTMETLKICSKGGGYAMGSGNTITSYMPPKNYLAMVRAVNDFNGVR